MILETASSPATSSFEPMKLLVVFERAPEILLTLAAHELKGRIEVVKDFGLLPRCDCYPS